ncbi:hypothetical protein IAT38_007707 [Cryptococcus sp. DSM 104549]
MSSLPATSSSPRAHPANKNFPHPFSLLPIDIANGYLIPNRTKVAPFSREKRRLGGSWVAKYINGTIMGEPAYESKDVTRFFMSFLEEIDEEDEETTFSKMLITDVRVEKGEKVWQDLPHVQDLAKADLEKKNKVKMAKNIALATMDGSNPGSFPKPPAPPSSTSPPSSSDHPSASGIGTSGQFPRVSSPPDPLPATLNSTSHSTSQSAKSPSHATSRVLGGTQPDLVFGTTYDEPSVRHAGHLLRSVIFAVIEIKFRPAYELEKYLHALPNLLREGLYQTIWYLSTTYTLCQTRLGLALVSEMFYRAAIADDGRMYVEAAAEAVEEVERRGWGGRDLTAVELGELTLFWEKPPNALATSRTEGTLDREARRRLEFTVYAMVATADPEVYPWPSSPATTGAPVTSYPAGANLGGKVHVDHTVEEVVSAWRKKAEAKSKRKSKTPKKRDAEGAAVDQLGPDDAGHEEKETKKKRSRGSSDVGAEEVEEVVKAVVVEEVVVVKVVEEVVVVKVVKAVEMMKAMGIMTLNIHPAGRLVNAWMGQMGCRSRLRITGRAATVSWGKTVC